MSASPQYIPMQPTDSTSQPLLSNDEPSDDFYPASTPSPPRKRFAIPRPSSRQLKIVIPIILVILILSLAHRSVPKEDLDWGIQYGQEKLGLHACSGWDPDNPKENDPPDCLRATQWRQVEKLMKRESTLQHYSPAAYAHNVQALARLKMCLKNEIKCPPRPVILSGWWYIAESVYENGGTTGEVIWMKSVIQQFEESGYILLATNGYKEMISMARVIPDIFHQVWTEDTQVVSCVTDPRCISPEHYRPQHNATSILDPDDPIPEAEVGVIPIWRLHSADYWGARPTYAANTDHWWGRHDSNQWSFNPIGAAWSVVPFKYPKHSFLPFSIEKICTTIPWVEHNDRKDSALIYAKKSSYFYGTKTPDPAVWAEMRAANLSVDFLSTANIDKPKLQEVPEGVTDIGFQTRIEYERLVSSVQVLIGIGAPTISPSVYTALCQGTPVVLPYFKADPTPEGWNLFSDWTSQHGPAISLGEPYVYAYKVRDKEDLRDKIQKAVDNPIGRYIPPDMKWNAAVARTKKHMSEDWEAKFNQVVTENGGEIPRVLAGVRERCFELHRCQFMPPEPRKGKVYLGENGGWADTENASS